MDNLSKEEIQKLIIPESHQQLLYQLVGDVSKILDENNIPYFIDGGTLLGAVRHHDLIPWDDDADFGMLTNDYFMKFPKVIKQIEKLGYSVDTSDTYLTKIYIKGKWLYDKFKTVGTPTLDIFPYVIKKGVIRLYKLEHYLKWKKAQYKVSDMYPLKDYKFGPIVLKGANNPYPYINGLYPDWQNTAVIELRAVDRFGASHKTKLIKCKIEDVFKILQENNILEVNKV